MTTLSAAFVLAGSTPAHAATADDFARLRQCESSGNYAINTGNGYYGAYQFDARTWHGLGYSGLPSDAAPATQDDAARRLQAARGWQPWPSCSRRLGLRRGSKTPVAAAAPQPAEPAEPQQIQQSVTAPAAGEAGVSEAPPAAVVDVLAVGTASAPPPPPLQPFAIDTTGNPREDVRVWQEQMARRGWDIVVDGFHGADSARVAAAFIEAKGLVQTPGFTLTEILWNASWEIPVT